MLMTRGSALIEICSDQTCRSVLTEALAFESVRQAFISAAEGKSALFPVLAGRGAASGSAVNVKFGYDEGLPALGLKAGTFWPGNSERGLSNHGATTVLLDPETGFLAAIVNATSLNRLRTAAANAVAVDCLAREDARSYGIIGTGQQAQHEIRAVARVRSIDKILIGARSRDKGLALAAAVADLGIATEIVTPELAAGADIVTTITNATSAVLLADWVKPGAHISAMGVDRVGKQELEPELLGRASLFADDPQQSQAIGECQHAVRLGIVPPSAITAIGNVLNGSAKGRSSAEEITIFDSSGLAAQDLVVASAVLREARARGLVQQVEF